ncbi:hypothetical protein CK498_03395 [Halomonas salipaludis]|uniref:Uncharacterized protein n=1 Tax=Halomonas salipaludis TaxID=2032625 RepID=A0A2A2F3Y3_9GAMM|nr:hypothetical protein CK498_03395 [Halomonas salipaludis]
MLSELIQCIKLSEEGRREVAASGANYVARVRKEKKPSMMEALIGSAARCIANEFAPTLGMAPRLMWERL